MKGELPIFLNSPDSNMNSASSYVTAVILIPKISNII